ncbi:hypothetical protein JOE66_001501 [Subtercola frigoramans]|uniref:Uncharacterized protein n=1 Tax=Subtercola frigoramans TaxID=120298 RepID=A0ABS2L444_9MICO|nr:hypothetical protein [Subtercola frigoramans]
MTDLLRADAMMRAAKLYLRTASSARFGPSAQGTT